ncbi:uncharacterized protein N7482_005326 [Penicillium canariense]|uniref:Vacuolar sorting protein Vps3844 C-terminal domain-containing protein n=1 Tax=Penicillium canariense TaxID=189055 RepID=A0A9W9I269_9EURO|nr:uncharacterized protein N7482_005326 [Penicillium canariense]KAJ5166545.1 hypothetical protein N7482_005326 [Penicillium canariense]
MRWVSKLLALAATGALGTHALEASIFTFPSGNQEDRDTISVHQTVSEDAARLILELRIKPSLGSVLGKVETDIVDRINEFSGTQHSLFGGSSDHEIPSRSIIIIEGVDEAVGTNMRKGQVQSIFVPHASSDLVDDSLGSFLGHGDVKKRCAYDQGAVTSETDYVQSAKECISQDPVFSHGQTLFSRDFLNLVDSVEIWSSKDQTSTVARLSLKTRSDDGALVVQSIKSLFHDLDKLASSESRDITAFLLPNSDASRDISRIAQRDTSTWSRSPASSSDAQGTLRKSAQGLAMSSVLAPVCHASNSSCSDATNNCSGHGHCYLKSGSGVEGTTDNCYACRCQTTVRTKSDGSTQKIYWGGPACQKEDISSPFFLIAGVSVLAIVLAGSAVGMLFSMGQEELPSVIGAGVGGSKAQM